MTTFPLRVLLVIWGFSTQVYSQKSIRHKPWCILLDSEYDSPRTWENNDVPYAVSSDFEEEFLEGLVRRGIENWNSKVRSVKLREKRDEDEDYLNFVPGDKTDVCYASVGRIGGEQNVTLGDYYCYLSIEHMIMHAVGFDHEHNRMDRDEHVRVLWDDLPSGYPEHYQKTNRSELNVKAGPYDFYSEVHFSYHIAGLGIQQFEVLDEGVDTDRMDVPSSDLSWREVYKIDRLFGNDSRRGD